MLQTLQSCIDRSVNFVRETSDRGYFEARYVRRADDYIVIYLSSHSGCRHACRFCHLTTTRQTTMLAATGNDFLTQADDVLSHYDSVMTTEGPASRVHFNWMARGEALSNHHLLTDFSEITHNLADMAASRGLKPIFNISTILPKTFTNRDLSTTFQCSSGEVVIYYSLYSLDERFRHRWIPNALPAEESLSRLAAYQRQTGRRIVLHWAYIEGENDRLEDAERIADAIRRHQLKAKFNLVRYNPYSDRQGRESSDDRLHQNFTIISSALGNTDSRIIPRVGFDVKASCGMFITTI